jgi:cysteine-rich repeat protein
MSSRWMKRVLLGAWLCGAPGCDVFDEQLEKRLDEANEEDDAGTKPPLMLSDVCEASRPEVTSDPDIKQVIPITGLRANVSESGDECVVSSDVLGRADGFFQITAKAGQRWHFHVDASPGQNLALLALDDGCDVRSCFAAADVCSTAESEHFTFVPASTGTYVIMVEGIDTTKVDDLTMLAVSPECGDGSQDHSEVCDDRNVTSGDGCDKYCRKELSAQNSEELEPNDDSFGANVLTARRDQPIIVRGKIAGMTCPADYYFLHLDTAQNLNAKVLKGAGGACTDAPPMSLRVLEAEAEIRQGSEVEAAPLPAKGACPELNASLAAGDYLIRLQHTEKAAQFDYRLTLTLTAPP